MTCHGITQTSAILEFCIWFRFWPYHHSRHVILHQFAKFYPNRTTLSIKKMTSCQFSRWPFSAILDFKGPIMGSLKSPCTNSSRSSIDTVALNCLVFWENHIFLAFLRQIDKQTNEQMDTTDALSRSRYREQRLNKFAKNCCKRTVLVQVIIEDIVTFFFGRPCIYNYPRF